MEGGSTKRSQRRVLEALEAIVVETTERDKAGRPMPMKARCHHVSPTDFHHEDSYADERSTGRSHDYCTMDNSMAFVLYRRQNISFRILPRLAG